MRDWTVPCVFRAPSHDDVSAPYTEVPAAGEEVQQLTCTKYKSPTLALTSASNGANATP